MSGPDDSNKNRVMVSLNMPSVCDHYIPYAKGIHYKMSNNSRFTSLSAKLTTFETNNNALSDAQTACTAKRPVGTVEDRDIAWKKSVTSLNVLKSDVQQMADLDPVNAKAIITDAGMSYYVAKGRSPQEADAVDGAEEGSVILYAGQPGPSNWRESKDDEHWNNLTGSKTSVKKLSGRIPGDVYFYQYSQPLPDGADGAWSASLRIRLKKY